VGPSAGRAARAALVLPPSLNSMGLARRPCLSSPSRDARIDLDVGIAQFIGEVNGVGVEGRFRGVVGKRFGVIDGEFGSACRVSEPRMLDRFTMRPAALLRMSGSSLLVSATWAKKLFRKLYAATRMGPV